jgi:ankyrin repeat protein
MLPTYLQSNPGPFQIVVLLLYYGENHSIRNIERRSPIYQEIKGEYYIQGGVYMAQRLTRVDVLAGNGQDKNQLTPLHLASLYGWVEMVRVLLDRGALANSEDNLGQTPLHMVSQGAYISQDDGVHIAQLLLKHGADVNAQDNNHATPSDLASHHGKLDIESLLLRYGEKANAKVDQGPTPNLLELKVVELHGKPA